MAPSSATIERFRELHAGPEPLLVPNPWDVGTARLLVHAGFAALATTSLGVANMHGRKRATAQQILDNVRSICAAANVPVTADLENCFADDPKDVGAIIVSAYECGASGISIEDVTSIPGRPIYDTAHAVERVAAAVEAARTLPTPPVVTARADGLLHGATNLDDIIGRLQAYERVGADVLYAPGLRTLDQMRTVVNAVSVPVNVVMGFADPTITLTDLQTIGVRRVSIGGGLSRIALRSFVDAATDMRNGNFQFVRHMAPIADLHAAF